MQVSDQGAGPAKRQRAIWIGIDPGVETGVAVAPRGGKLEIVTSLPIHAAMAYVAHWAEEREQQKIALHVIFEDARKARFRARSGRDQLRAAAQAQGAGSVKRDCGIWEDYLTTLGVPFTAMPPDYKLTKMSAGRFAVMTGWKERTNSHGRDAAMLVFGK